MPDVESITCQGKGWEFIAWLKTEGLFLIPLDAENQWFRFHHLFQKLLLRQLKRRYSTEVINTLHTRASAWYVENGLLEEVLQHALAAGNAETATSLITGFSPELMNSEQWTRLDRCLCQLPRGRIEQDPALLVLEAWLHVVRQNFSQVADCVDRIEALNATSPPDNWVNIKDVQGQFETLKGLVRYIAADGKSALAYSRQALDDIPPHHKRARLFANLYQLGAYQMTGDLDTGLSNYQKAMQRFINRDKNYHTLYLGSLGLIYWVDANLSALRETAECLLDVAKENPLSAAVSFGLYFLGMVQYHRNDLENAEKNLARVVGIYKTSSPMNYAHGAFALALTHQARGEPDRAREISSSVVQDAIETNNVDMLQVARAFEAELALRQARYTPASQWLEKYHAKPFVPPFRFYMPQLTAVKILLAQNTTDSRSKVADLLGQLQIYLESIHNNRFRIDVLALQALLHHARGEEPAALEKLTQALALAEPGGFIRLFVDLGSRMADLLKLLIQNNIAVKYAGKILAAYREDGLNMISLSPDPPLSSSPAVSASQPLPEPLSKRELEILNLLVQRLPTKEIASKVFIAPSTAKKHLGNIYRKLNVNNRHQAAAKADALGILKRGR